MLDIQIGFSKEEDYLYLGGDGEDLGIDTLNLISNIYYQLIQTCPQCAEIYKTIISDMDNIQKCFVEVENSFFNELEEESRTDEFVYETDKLYGFDEYLKTKRGKE